jgi:hypothetical protein
MATRPDISDKVIHFTKAATHEAALGLLLKIVGEGRLLGGTGMIRGGYRCVCFTEAPLPAMAAGFVNAGSFTRYSPFGLMFEKTWVYAHGARPVIYQPDVDFDTLPEEMRWRHVRYEPLGSPVVDFTWEREWRLRCDELHFSPGEVVLVVPNNEWEAFVFGIWDSQQQLEAEAYSMIFDQTILEQMYQPCPWRIVSLAP